MSTRQEQSHKKPHPPEETETEGLTEGLVLIALMLAIFLVGARLALIVDNTQLPPLVVDDCRVFSSTQWLNLLAHAPDQSVTCRVGQPPTGPSAAP
ncbi:MAG: hypothetical protein P4M00_08780 [Azospirillaceae bacterium]|nr:hypothetical protein [Azospirillaceae bacterium]